VKEGEIMKLNVYNSEPIVTVPYVRDSGYMSTPP